MIVAYRTLWINLWINGGGVWISYPQFAHPPVDKVIHRHLWTSRELSTGVTIVTALVHSLTHRPMWILWISYPQCGQVFHRVTHRKSNFVHRFSTPLPTDLGTSLGINPPFPLCAPLGVPIG